MLKVVMVGYGQHSKCAPIHLKFESIGTKYISCSSLITGGISKFDRYTGISTYSNSVDGYKLTPASMLAILNHVKGQKRRRKTAVNMLQEILTSEY